MTQCGEKVDDYSCMKKATWVIRKEYGLSLWFCDKHKERSVNYEGRLQRIKKRAGLTRKEAKP